MSEHHRYRIMSDVDEDLEAASEECVTEDVLASMHTSGDVQRRVQQGLLSQVSSNQLDELKTSIEQQQYAFAELEMAKEMDRMSEEAAKALSPTTTPRWAEDDIKHNHNDKKLGDDKFARMRLIREQQKLLTRAENYKSAANNDAKMPDKPSPTKRKRSPTNGTGSPSSRPLDALDPLVEDADSEVIAEVISE
jgi:hypothetical protein